MSVKEGTRFAVGAFLQGPAHPARTTPMTKKTVLAIAIDPSLVDFSAFPGLTSELVNNFIPLICPTGMLFAGKPFTSAPRLLCMGLFSIFLLGFGTASAMQP
jgi:hypothetical protein